MKDFCKCLFIHVKKLGYDSVALQERYLIITVGLKWITSVNILLKQPHIDTMYEHNKNIIEPDLPIQTLLAVARVGQSWYQDDLM